MVMDLVKNTKDIEIQELKQQLEELKSRPIQVEAQPQGPAFEAEKSDERDVVQIELDTTEEFVLNTMFPNGIKVSPFVKTFLTMKGQTEIDVINTSITQFEQMIKPFMSPDGTLVLTGKPSELVRLLAPLIEKFGRLIGG